MQMPPLPAFLHDRIRDAGQNLQICPTGFYPRLPSALEGPTPPQPYSIKTVQTLRLCPGDITTLSTAICSLTQNDILKDCCFLLSSRLGLVIATIAFLHTPSIVCSGSIIHNVKGEQDIQNTAVYVKHVPSPQSHSASSLAPTSAPPHRLLLWIPTPRIALAATTPPAIYGPRIISFTLLGQPRFSTFIVTNENIPLLSNSTKWPLIRNILPDFLFPTTVPQSTTPYYLKLMALAVTSLGFILTLELNLATQNLKFDHPSNLFKLSDLLRYLPTIIPHVSLHVSLPASQKSSLITTRLHLSRKTITKIHFPLPNEKS
ncbi:hypothetical protein HPG69_014737 [Diceros bicornis minor]|uniref:NADH dehydrogenase subunit 5 C-terminal domain-containing protein n=1 Tax=Diceros bicornis minor TaxID=77932 RepID=A0A7J7EL96_DICBM|nr:hypothetical protein HPG69_014737 [Diceros bicornis minor]